MRAMHEYPVVRHLTDDELLEEFLSNPGLGLTGPVDRRWLRETRRPKRDPFGVLPRSMRRRRAAAGSGRGW